MNKKEIKDEIITIIREASPNDITADQIYLKLTERVDPGRTQETIRKTIRELVNANYSLIGSSSKGYFYINSKVKLEEAISYLLNRVPFLERRADALRKLWNEENNQGGNG
ncbi:hypothetical protein LJ707_16185 [Mucilaginibacter sp. UR6-1]|uniref:hypothetical protein n=1 Tax=Mucilaginibacter sp. UR6-1 TaxID=1435643 RepID=UPI001E344C61|nr:hypothetical protein [Mucilaginibacter sp. UR6-1]MCC8410482.1 hypothetical protein [Mucilaginibacter sp. UR6-1]